MRTSRFAKGIVMAAVGLTATAICGLCVGSPAEGWEEPEYFVISHGRDIAIVSSSEEDMGALVERYGYDADEFILDVQESDGYTAVKLLDAMDVSVTCDGQTFSARASGGTVEQLLNELDVELGEEDIVSHEAGEPVYDGLSVRIYRVTYGEEYEEETVAHGVEYVDNDEIYKGMEKTVTQGADGTKRIYYKVKYVDGVEESRELSREETVREPVNTVIERGTKEKPAPKQEPEPKKASSDAPRSKSSDKKSDVQETPVKTPETPEESPEIPQESPESPKDAGAGGTVTAASGEVYTYSRVLTMKATAYSYDAGGMTSSGVPAQVGIVAALPGTLPQGTRVYIVTEDGEYTYGPAVVGDTPGSDIIDIFFETEAECERFGVRQAKVYVLGR